MGAWAAGGFANDEALDYLAEIRTGSLLDVFGFIVNFQDSSMFDLDLCTRFVVASEVVAASRGMVADDFPEELSDWLVQQGGTAGDALAISALKLLDKMQEQSALQAAWHDSDSFEEWTKEINLLKERLSRRSRKTELTEISPLQTSQTVGEFNSGDIDEALSGDLESELRRLYSRVENGGAALVIVRTDEILGQDDVLSPELAFLIHDLRASAFEHIKDYDAMMSSSNEALSLFAESANGLALPFFVCQGIYESSGAVNMVLDLRATRAWLAYRHPRRTQGISAQVELRELRRLTDRPESVFERHLESHVEKVMKLFYSGGFAKAASEGRKLLQFADELPVVHQHLAKSYRALGDEALAEQHAERYLFYKGRSGHGDSLEDGEV